MRYAIGVDFGGTNTKIALVSEEGSIIEKGTFPTPNPFNKEKWILRDRIKDLDTRANRAKT